MAEDPAKLTTESALARPGWWRRFLWVRLTAITAIALAIVLGVIVWFTARVLATSAERTGADRLLAAATQTAGTIAQNTARGWLEMQRLSSDGALAAYLTRPNPTDASRLQQRFRPLLTPGQPPLVVMNADGNVVLTLRAPDESDPASLPAPTSVPATLGIGPLREERGLLFTDVVTEITDASDAPRRVGYLVLRRVIQPAASQDTLGRLMGSGAVASMGNKDGRPWSNFSRLVDPPQFDASKRQSERYVAADRTRHLIAMAPVDGTPWAIAIDLPQSQVLAPITTVVRRMTLLAIVSGAMATLAVGLVLARAMRPLHELTEASEAIAAGDYARRVGASRPDEIGRLGRAFNSMSSRVADTYHDLDARVKQRTATLEETRALLETRVAELTKARSELDQFFALSPDMLRITTVAGDIRRLNDAWKETLGWEVEELLSTTRTRLVHPDDLERTEEAIRELRRTGVTQKFENRYRTKDGGYRWLQWRAIVIPGTDIVLSSARDVTEQRGVEAELEKRAAELAALNGELETFSYSVSHDLRAPLRHVQGFAALLAKSPTATLSETDRRWLETIDSAATRMSRLIDDLLSLSRTTRTELRKVSVSLASIVADARQELSADPQSARVQWRIDPLPSVTADPSLLRLVFVNLLSNALKYTRHQAAPMITVGAWPANGNEAVCFVRDNGVGFEQQYAHKLFGVFQRLHADHEFEGTGIGLANVRRIIHRHGGRVWAQGEPGEGATFFIALPS